MDHPSFCKYECGGEGYCPHYKIHMPKSWVKMCTDFPATRAMWLKGMGPGQPKGMAAVAASQHVPLPEPGPSQEQTRMTMLPRLSQEAYERTLEEARRRTRQGIGRAEGVGSELKRLLSKFFLNNNGTCGCDQKAEFMNLMGPEWCEQNIESVVDWLEQAAKQRRLPFVRAAGRLLVRRAIRNTSRKLSMLQEGGQE